MITAEATVPHLQDMITTETVIHHHLTVAIILTMPELMGIVEEK